MIDVVNLKLPTKYVGEAISLPILLSNILKIVGEGTILTYNDNGRRQTKRREQAPAIQLIGIKLNAAPRQSAGGFMLAARFHGSFLTRWDKAARRRRLRGWVLCNQADFRSYRK